MPRLISRSAKLFVFFFSIPFLLIGCFGIFKFFEIAFISGSGGNPYPFLMYGLVFGFAGLLVNFIARGTKKVSEGTSQTLGGSVPEEESDDEPDLLKPWRDYDKWKGGKIEADTQARMVALWIGAVVLLGVSIPIILQIFTQPNTEGIFIYLFLIFPVVGVLLLFLAIQATFQWRKFGRSIFAIRNETGYVGGVLAGTLSTTALIQASSPYEFSLQCLERITKGSGKNKQTTTHLRWDSKATVPHQGYNSQAGVPISISIPDDCFETDDEKAEGTVSWELSVRAKVSGVDYYARFDVPVFRKRE